MSRLRQVMPNGDELISEYGDGWQRGYVITKGQLDYWEEQESNRVRAHSSLPTTPGRDTLSMPKDTR